MAGWTTDQIADLLISTQHDLGELKWENLAFDLTEYHAWSQIWSKEKHTVDGGTAMDFNLQVSNNGQARSVEMYSEDDYNFSDTLKTGTVPWKHVNTNYVMNRIRMNMNRSKRKLVDEVKLERNRALGSLIELCERLMWSVPVSGSLDFYGVPYWVPKYQTGTTTLGFNGTLPTGFSTVAGIDASTTANAKYRSYTGQYTSVTKADLIKKMKHMARATNFKAPIQNPNYAMGAQRRAYYADMVTVELMEDLAEAQNDKLGFDMDPAGGLVRFQRHAVNHVPYFDSDDAVGGNPVYQLDWSVFGVKFLSGEDMVETTRKASKSQKNVTTDIDCTLNTWCANRRPLGVLSKTSIAGA